MCSGSSVEWKFIPLRAGRFPGPGLAWDWAVANQKKKDAITQLASLSAAMDDIDARIDVLAERTRNLDLD